MSGYLPYFVARAAAHELDRQGIAPGRVVTVLAGLSALCVAGLLGLAALVGAWLGLVALGIVT